MSLFRIYVIDTLPNHIYVTGTESKENEMTNQIIEMVQRRREEAGLKLVWFVPSEGRDFTAYATDEAQKAAWLKNSEAKGWIVK